MNMTEKIYLLEAIFSGYTDTEATNPSRKHFTRESPFTFSDRYETAVMLSCKGKNAFFQTVMFVYTNHKFTDFARAAKYTLSNPPVESPHSSRRRQY